ncbi:PREDICTED: uncharacterized protein At5g65660-like [Nicotiana attenuata]|uniref:Hydroxyproline-rich glycoprotein family protein n=1 Tax=Nicotiana attenuata TaxID=49451 RepID=A0A314KQU2_NICAT|nr:PREDICTED: uncharacterized protein At5g65660-like [Nicotiana attenuata]OIT31114.1 uncharacterized protein A4A49_30630 [Nicotiana attenuata]
MGNNNNLGITSSRPTIAFPLGLALLVLVLVCITGIFACCYHWNKLRSLLCSSASATHLDDQSSDGSVFKIIQAQKQKNGESLTILMPGDEVPKFVALPTPHRCTLQL